MAAPPRIWRPGSFTKNFSWGQAGSGLAQLHRTIRIGFDGKLQDTPRSEFRQRISALPVPDYIPINFFLFNQVRESSSILFVDELVYWAVAKAHSSDFDRLAAFALNLSIVGQWRGAREGQRYPAEWAKNFVVDEVFKGGGWDTKIISADAIESYVSSSPMYVAEGARKLATNLNYIYRLADLASVRTSRLSEWWGAALFLALDRITSDRQLELAENSASQLLGMLKEEKFFELTAISPMEGEAAASDLIHLYREAGGRDRFFELASLGPQAAIQPTTGTPSREFRFLDQEKARRPVERVFASASRQVRDRRLVKILRALYVDACALCGKQLVVNRTGSTYCEVGHIKPVGNPIKGPDHVSNLLPFCPNHHCAFDRGGLLFAVEKGKILVRDYIKADLGGRVFEPHPEHDLDVDYLRWHAEFFS